MKNARNVVKICNTVKMSYDTMIMAQEMLEVGFVFNESVPSLHALLCCSRLVYAKNGDLVQQMVENHGGLKAVKLNTLVEEETMDGM